MQAHLAMGNMSESFVTLMTQQVRAMHKSSTDLLKLTNGIS